MPDLSSDNHSLDNALTSYQRESLFGQNNAFGDRSDDDAETSQDDGDNDCEEEYRLEHFKYNAREAFKSVKGCDLEIEDDNRLPYKVREEIHKIKAKDRSVICLRVVPRDSMDALEQRKKYYESRGVEDTTEAYGFHGTSHDAASAIISLGFRPVRTKNGSACGKGIYLASNLNLALQTRYAVEEKGMQTVLICRFIKGRSKDTSARDETTNPHEYLTGGSRVTRHSCRVAQCKHRHCDHSRPLSED